jgi:hypothetical protein
MYLAQSGPKRDLRIQSNIVSFEIGYCKPRAVGWNISAGLRIQRVKSCLAPDGS